MGSAYPRSLERQLAARLKRRHRLIRTLVLEALHRMPRQDASEEPPSRARVWFSTTITALLDRLRQALGIAAPMTMESLLPLARSIDSTVTRTVVAELETATPGTVLAPLAARPLLQLQQEWAAATAARIRLAEEDALRRALEAAAEAAAAGTDVERAATAALGASEVRAAALARDAVGSFTGIVSRTRAPSLGSNSYRWVTMHDSRVRPAHADLDGTVHSWTDPGPANGYYPGGDFGCRCTAQPV